MKLSTQISLGFFIAICIDLLDSSVNYSLTLKVNKNTSFLSNSELISRYSGDLNNGIVNMQNALRGFLLTDNARFLAKYDTGLTSIPLIIREEKNLLSSPAQRRRLDSIAALHSRWTISAGRIIVAKKRAASSAAAQREYQSMFINHFKSQNGLSYNDRVDSIFKAFNQHEYKVREDRRTALTDSIKETERFSALFSSLMILIGSGMAFYLVKKISHRIDSMVKLAENISNGDFTQVSDDKKDELSSLSVSLNSMSGKLSRNIRELEKKNDELNQFAYVVSHDLKAPVRGIYNVLQWIGEDLEGEISPKMRGYLNIIPERMHRMENLVDGLLAYARLSGEKPAPEDVDVRIMIGEIAEMLATRECKFTLNNLPQLRTEKLLLQQVFSNLLGNAVKYASRENPEIMVSCVEHNTYYEFTVTDNGPGIEKEYHQKIFEIFQTLREKDDKESTGIGLAIVKKIIDDKHGSIKVVSSKGKGASFIFTWPKD
jgi:signal transduction histidine kinase